jgi:hypothetical protein
MAVSWMDASVDASGSKHHCYFPDLGADGNVPFLLSLSLMSAVKLRPRLDSSVILLTGLEAM